MTVRNADGGFVDTLRADDFRVIVVLLLVLVGLASGGSTNPSVRDDSSVGDL